MLAQSQATSTALPAVLQPVRKDVSRDPTVAATTARVDPSRNIDPSRIDASRNPPAPTRSQGDAADVSADGDTAARDTADGAAFSNVGPVATANLIASGADNADDGAATAVSTGTSSAQADAELDPDGAVLPDGEPETNAEGLTRSEQRVVEELALRDQEVRDHEEAHARVGGQFAGQPSYDYQTGPDGEAYAVSGSVPIDVAPVPDDPEATIAKMEVVRDAALAPAEPSAADRRIAALADAQRLAAIAELQLNRAMALSDMSDQELTELTAELFRQTDDRPQPALDVAA